jgi:trigger factor
VKVTQDKVEERQAYLTIEMEPAEVEDGLKKAYNKLVKKYNIPGFRKGKTPRPILEQYLGKEVFLEEAVEIMAPDAYEKAAKEKDLKAISRPEVNLESTEPVMYKMVVPLEPLVTLGDYKSIRIPEEKAEVKEEDVDKTLEQVQKQYASWNEVDREVRDGDSVTLDIESKVGEQPYINQKDAAYEVDKESDFPLKGFAEQLIDMKKEETKEFKLTFPEDYGRAELAGKEVEFKVTLKSVKEKSLPDLDDELAKKVNPECEGMEDLKVKIRESLNNMAEQNARNDYEQKVVDALVEQSTIEYPPVMVEQEVGQLMKMQMQRWGLDESNFEQYLSSMNKSVEDFRKDLEPAAVKSVKQSLVLGEIAQKEDVKITDEDVNNEVKAMAQNYNEEQQKKMMQMLTIPQNQMSFASNIAFKKAIERMVAIASGRGEESVQDEKSQSPAGDSETESANEASEENKAAETIVEKSAEGTEKAVEDSSASDEETKE